MISAIVAALIAIATAAIIAWYQLTQVAVMPGQDGRAGFQPLVEVGGPFELVDHTGKAVTDANYRGEFLLVFFGYTYCPDICPTELQNVALALDELGDKAGSVRPLFITIDPERDTVEYISQYVAHFHPRLVGLTGTTEQIERAARLYRVFYAKVEDPQATEYLMDHSSFVYLMGRGGEFLTMFPHGIDPSRMAETIGAYVDQAS
jgi:protein SCO1/2